MVRKKSAQLDAEIAAVISKPQLKPRRGGSASSASLKDPTEDAEWAEIDSEYAGTVQSLIDDGYSREEARASAEDNIRDSYGAEVLLWLPKHERRRRASTRGLHATMKTVYHRTTPDAARAIETTGRFKSREGNDVFVSNRRGGIATGYGDAVVVLRVPSSWLRLDDVFPDGEQHYTLDKRVLTRAHIVDTDEG